MIKRFTIVTLGFLLVSGCSTYSLEKLRHTKPKGNTFQSALAKMYMDFSASEENDYDWQDSWHFADKGLLAVYGKDVAPEYVEDWNVPSDKIAHLKKARKDLIAALTPEIIAEKPKIAARAQFNFDCWIEYQEEDWQPAEIEACRDNFVRALIKIDSGSEKKSKRSFKRRYKKAHKKINKNTPKKIENKTTASVMPTTTFFMLVFEPKEAILTKSSALVLSDIVKTLVSQDKKGYEVLVNDKSASKKDNLKLSMERIQAVKNRLIEAGIEKSSIKNGNVKEKPIKRRVEIFLNE